MISPLLWPAVLTVRANRKKQINTDVYGKRILIDRAEGDSIDCIVHVPETDRREALPLLIELHGGAWVAGDASMLDSLCETISVNTPAVTVNLNYKKLDVHSFPYQFHEVCDTVAYFGEHAEEYGIDPDKIAVCGQSAGAHITAGACLLARDTGVRIARQILIYPFLDCTGRLSSPMGQVEGRKRKMLDRVKKMFFGGMPSDHEYLSPVHAKAEKLLGIAPADIIVCGTDALKVHGDVYYEKLKEAGVEATYRNYEDAVHGFVEVNRPDFRSENPAKNEEQAALERDCENYICEILRNL